MWGTAKRMRRSRARRIQRLSLVSITAGRTSTSASRHDCVAGGGETKKSLDDDRVSCNDELPDFLLDRPRYSIPMHEGVDKHQESGWPLFQYINENLFGLIPNGNGLEFGQDKDTLKRRSGISRVSSPEWRGAAPRMCARWRARRNRQSAA